MTLVAIRKDEGSIPGSGFHYMMMPMKMESPFQAYTYSRMGFKILELEDDIAERLLKESNAALVHQIEVANFTEDEKYWWKPTDLKAPKHK